MMSKNSFVCIFTNIYVYIYRFQVKSLLKNVIRKQISVLESVL